VERRSLLLAIGSPDQLGEPIGRHDAVRLDRQQSQDEALPGEAEVDRVQSRSARKPPNIHNRIRGDGRRCNAGQMANKVPEKHNAKKPGKSLKEKRADKKKKQSERRSG
jgi:hypothetical protein